MTKARALAANVRRFIVRKATSLSSIVLILAAYACMGIGAFLLNTVVGFFVLGLLLLVFERSVDRGDDTS